MASFGELTKRFLTLFYFIFFQSFFFRTTEKTLFGKSDVDNKLQHKEIACDLKFARIVEIFLDTLNTD
jgi:hypothetical protein